MTIANPPTVRIGTSGWLATEWDTTITADAVQRQPTRMTSGNARYVYWTVWQEQPVPVPQVCRLKVACSSAPTQQATGAAITLSPGTYPVRLRFTTSSEVWEDDSDPIVVVP